MDIVREEEDKCLKWLCEHADEILQCNERLESAISLINAVHTELTAYTDSMDNFVSIVSELNRQAISVTEETHKKELLTRQLHDYIQSILLPSHLASALEKSGPHDPTFWQALSELEAKMEYVHKISVDGEIPWTSLKDATAKLMKLNDCANKAMRRHVKECLIVAFRDNANVHAARTQFMKEAQASYLHLKRWHHPCVQEIIQEYITTLKSIYSQIVDQMLAKARQARIMTSDDFEQALVDTGFDCFRLQTKKETPVPTFEWFSTLRRNTTISRSQTLRRASLSKPTSADAILPSHQVISIRFNIITKFPKLTETYDLICRTRIASVIRPSVDDNKVGQHQNDITTVEEIFRSIIKNVLQLALSEYRFIETFFDHEANEQIGEGSEPMTSSEHNGGETAEESETSRDVSSKVPNKNINLEYTRRRSSISALANNRSNESAYVHIQLPISRTFMRIFRDSFRIVVNTVIHTCVQENYDILSLILILRLCDCFDFEKHEEGLEYPAQIIDPIRQACLKQVANIAHMLQNAVNVAVEPIIIGPNPYTTANFTRKGIGKGLDDAPIVSVQILARMVACVGISLVRDVQTYPLCSKAELLSILQNICKLLGNLSFGDDEYSPSTAFRIYADTIYIQEIIDLIVDLSEDADVTSVIEDLQESANLMKSRSGEIVADHCIQLTCSDLLKYISDAERCIEESKADEILRIKMAKLTNIDFVKNLRHLNIIFSQECASTLGKEELRKQVLTKYVVAHSRLLMVLNKLGVYQGKLIESDTLMHEMNQIFEV